MTNTRNYQKRLIFMDLLNASIMTTFFGDASFLILEVFFWLLHGFVI